MTDDFSLSRQLLRPETLKEVLVCKAPCRWRSITDRIGPNAPLTVEFITRWWWDFANILPWLQRVYLEEAFPRYDPTADREDDTPYNWDHIVPRNDWGSDWREMSTRLQREKFAPRELENVRWVRGDVGTSIGNGWLVDLSVNRGWNDASPAYKLKDIEKSAQRDQALTQCLPGRRS